VPVRSRGPHRGELASTWTPERAYAVGLMATDGNLSRDGRHLTAISADPDLICHFSVDRYHVVKDPRYVYERLYVTLVSASRPFLDWIRGTVLPTAKEGPGRALSSAASDSR
jgi:hypothetical protein